MAYVNRRAGTGTHADSETQICEPQVRSRIEASEAAVTTGSPPRLDVCRELRALRSMLSHFDNTHRRSFDAVSSAVSFLR